MTTQKDPTIESLFHLAADYKPARNTLNDAFSNGVGYAPDSLFAPIKEVLEHPEIRKKLDSPIGKAALDSLGVKLDLNAPITSSLFHTRMLGSAHKIANMSTVKDNCCAPHNAPEITEITTTPAGQDFCCPKKGQQVKSLKMGMIVTVWGKGFDTVASRNIVRLGDMRLPVTMATENSLVVCIVAPVTPTKDSYDWDTGKCDLSIETSAGSTSYEVIVDEIDSCKATGDLDRFISGTRDVFGLMANRLGASSPYFQPLSSSAINAEANTLIKGTNLLLGEASKSLEAFQGAITILNQSGISKNITATLDNMVQNSGLLDDLAFMRQGLEDPTTAFLSGSGIIEKICEFTKWVWKIVIFLIVLLLVVALIIGLMVIFGPEGWAVIVVLVLIAKVLTIAIKAMVMVAVVVTVVYFIIKIIEKLWDWYNTPSPSSAPQEPMGSD